MRRVVTLKRSLGGFKEGDILKGFHPIPGWLAYGTPKMWWPEDFVETHPELFDIKES